MLITATLQPDGASATAHEWREESYKN